MTRTKSLFCSGQFLGQNRVVAISMDQFSHKFEIYVSNCHTYSEVGPEHSFNHKKHSVQTSGVQSEKNLGQPCRPPLKACKLTKSENWSYDRVPFDYSSNDYVFVLRFHLCTIQNRDRSCFGPMTTDQRQVSCSVCLTTCTAYRHLETFLSSQHSVSWLHPSLKFSRTYFIF